MNPLKQMNQCGTSVWLDNISRGIIASGELKKLIAQDGISGLTSNPTIFQKSISGTTDYDATFKQLLEEGLSDDAIYERLVVKDIQDAADLFLPVYGATKTHDGYVSLEVSPLLAYDTAGTIQEAQKLWGTVNRKNLYVKVPATREGLPAITELIAQGINVNVTLIFSVDRYREVAEAYQAGLERRYSNGLSLRGVSSVASFFISRLDATIDKLLETKDLEKAQAPKELVSKVLHQTAVANARVAYDVFQTLCQSVPFQELEKNGAMRQRVLWASTSTKNPDLSDVLYVEPLIGPMTVNTMPPATIDAARDHARVSVTIQDKLAESKETLALLEDLGIDYTAVTDRLEADGVEAFKKSFEDLMECISQKRGQLSPLAS